ncbi:patatin-like phospholipase family protein, partial [Nostoc sp. NIES-2111]
EPPEAPRRPRIALVLGSGGVRSAAAIGVAEVLEGAGLTPDLVVGCSSGALFGALVASRTPADVAMERAVRLWSPDLTRRRNWIAYAQLLMPRLAGFNADFSMRHSGLIAARVAEAFGDVQLEGLPVPLRVVATSSDTGARAVLSRGPLVEALCASMAVPFIFPPVRIGSQRLVDGVICDPLPVSVAYDADIILTLGFEGRMPTRVDRPAKLFGQVSTALLNNLMEARLETSRALGKVIVPVELQLTQRVGLWETAALPAMREAGRSAMNRAMRSLRGALIDFGFGPPQRRHHPA